MQHVFFNWRAILFITKIYMALLTFFKSNSDGCLCSSITIKQLPGFVQVLENLESPGILLWHFPGLESPGKRPLVLQSSGNLLNSTKNLKSMEGSKEN